VFRDGDQVELGSRNERPLTRYFPQLVDAVKRQLPARCVIDAEIMVPDPTGRRLDFRCAVAAHPPRGQPGRPAGLPDLGPPGRLRPACPGRHRLDRPAVHPAPRGPGGCPRPGRAADPPDPGTTDRDLALDWLGRFEGAGLDGVVAKQIDAVYEPDRRGWFKVKHTRTADCVVGGCRLHKRGADLVGSLLLGLYTQDGELASLGRHRQGLDGMAAGLIPEESWSAPTGDVSRLVAALRWRVRAGVTVTSLPT